MKEMRRVRIESLGHVLKDTRRYRARVYQRRAADHPESQKHIGNLDAAMTTGTSHGRDQQRDCFMKIVTMLGLSILTLAGCATQMASSGDNDMIELQNKEVVSDFFERFSEGEIDAAFEMVSDDVGWWVPGDLPFSGTKTKTEYLQVVAAIQTGFPGGLQLNPTSMIAEGNKVAVEVASYGDHVSGKTYTNKYHFLITIKDHKLVDVKEYMDTLHLHQLLAP